MFKHDNSIIIPLHFNPLKTKTRNIANQNKHNSKQYNYQIPNNKQTNKHATSLRTRGSSIGYRERHHSSDTQCLKTSLALQ